MNGWLIAAASLVLLFLGLRLWIRWFSARPLSTFDEYAVAVDTAVDTRPRAPAAGLPGDAGASGGLHVGPDPTAHAELAAPADLPGQGPSVHSPVTGAGSTRPKPVPEPRPGSGGRFLPTQRTSGEDRVEVPQAHPPGR